MQKIPDGAFFFFNGPFFRRGSLTVMVVLSVGRSRLYTGIFILENAHHIFEPRHSPDQSTSRRGMEFYMVSHMGVISGAIEAFLEFQPRG